MLDIGWGWGDRSLQDEIDSDGFGDLAAPAPVRLASTLSEVAVQLGVSKEEVRIVAKIHGAALKDGRFVCSHEMHKVKRQVRFMTGRIA